MPIRANWPEPESDSKQMQGIASAAIEKRRPMEAALDRLNSSIDELKSILDLLEKKLQPYLSSEPPTAAEGPAIPRDGNSPLAGAITNSANEVYIAINYIRRIAGRIE